jgi:hypothetical protein
VPRIPISIAANRRERSRMLLAMAIWKMYLVSGVIMLAVMLLSLLLRRRY